MQHPLLPLSLCASVLNLIVLSAAATSAALTHGEPPSWRLESVTVKVDVDHPTHAISKHLYGLFLEDISQSVDGCFYPELVWNRGFEFPPSPTVAEPKFQEKGVKLDDICGWKPDCRDGAAGRFTLEYADPAFTNTPAYLRIEAFARGAGMRNTGAMDEMSLAGGVPLDLSLWARGVPFEVRLEDASNRVLAAASFTPGATWGRYTATLTPCNGQDARCPSVCRQAHLTILPKVAGVLDVDQVSLMPHARFRERVNGLRTDIATLLADLKPSTFRFPGGCMLEGDSFASWWDWKRTVGPVEERRPIWNIWGYYQTLGLGYYEYLQFCEDIGAEPVPVFLAGLTCQFRGPKFVPVEALGAFITNVLDGVEFARGGADTKWGAVRAAMGHPAPFRLSYVALGNENWGPEYWTRYNVIQKAVKATHPDLKIVAAVDPHAYMRTNDWEYSWSHISPANADVADEHLYASPSWWLNHSGMYDAYPRKGVDVYVGEWATRQASDAYINSLYNAVAEAAFRMGFERNADLVKMSAYAPLIRRMGVPGNRYSLIQLSGTASCGAPAYWCERMFAENRPDRLVPCAYPVVKAIQPAGIDRPKWSYNRRSEAIEVVSFHAVAGVTGDELVLKFANAAWRPQPVSLDFGRALPACAARRTVLTGAPDAKILPEDPRRVVPVSDTVTFPGGTTFAFNLPACSVTVLRFKIHQ